VEIPADIRIIRTNDLVKVDNSLLTGDSDPEHVSTDLLHDDPTKTRNVAFYKTKMVGGNFQGVVIRTGERTLIARMSRTSQTKEKLLEMLSKFVMKVLIICLKFANIFIYFYIRFTCGLQLVFQEESKIHMTNLN
jgi:sodium/potassium-transporting ATPase subunit alpha